MSELFTNNKQIVRELNYKFIERKFHDRENDLVYMGLPSAEMKDVLVWKKYIKFVYAIEIGKTGEQFIRQHGIYVTAFKEQLINMLRVLRGDIDEIIINKKDNFGNKLEYPFDLVNLDYCSGVIYRQVNQPKALRLEALRELFNNQAEFQKDFMLILSVNLDHDKTEIIKTLDSMKNSLENMNYDNSVIDEIKKHEYEEVRLKIYVLYVISSLANNYYKVEFTKPIHYEGNNRTRMMNFQFYFKFDSNMFAPRVDIHEFKKIINTKMINVDDGIVKDSEIIIPMLL